MRVFFLSPYTGISLSGGVADAYMFTETCVKDVLQEEQLGAYTLHRVPCLMHLTPASHVGHRGVTEGAGVNLHEASDTLGRLGTELFPL